MVVIVNNPPAFPTSHEEPDDYNGHNNSKKTVIDQGMTLRDYMAAKALQGYISARGWHPDYTYPANFNFDVGKRAADAVAVASYQYADAMLKAREQ
jgi:hypothetical protein